MNILHIAPLTMNKSSGLTYSIPNLVKAQNSVSGIRSDLLVSIKTKEIVNDFYYLDDFNTRIELEKFINDYDIVVFHSTYIYSHIKISKILKRKNIPYIIVPRGGFSKKSKNIKKVKKFLGDMIMFNRFFKSSSAIHFLTENEKLESCYKTDYDFIVPNGIDNLEKNNNIKNESSEIIKFIYIGRIHSYIKGLDVLIDAVNIIKNDLRDLRAEFLLYGPDLANSKEKLNRQIQICQIEDIVKIKEAIFYNEKVKVLSDADVFIQTSRFEGLPMGVLEALSIGLPCILTPGTNLSNEVEEYGAGYEVALTSQSISLGILKIIDEIRVGKDFSSNAHLLAKKYSWTNIAKTSIENYKVIIKKGKKI